MDLLQHFVDVNGVAFLPLALLLLVALGDVLLRLAGLFRSFSANLWGHFGTWNQTILVAIASLCRLFIQNLVPLLYLMVGNSFNLGSIRVAPLPRCPNCGRCCSAKVGGASVYFIFLHVYDNRGNKKSVLIGSDVVPYNSHPRGIKESTCFNNFTISFLDFRNRFPPLLNSTCLAVVKEAK